MTSLHVICDLGPPQSKILATPMHAAQMQEVCGALQDIKVKQLEYEKNFEDFYCPSKQAIDLLSNESFNNEKKTILKLVDLINFLN